MQTMVNIIEAADSLMSAVIYYNDKSDHPRLEQETQDVYDALFDRKYPVVEVLSRLVESIGFEDWDESPEFKRVRRAWAVAITALLHQHDEAAEREEYRKYFHLYEHAVGLRRVDQTYAGQPSVLLVKASSLREAAQKAWSQLTADDRKLIVRIDVVGFGWSSLIASYVPEDPAEDADADFPFRED